MNIQGNRLASRIFSIVCGVIFIFSGILKSLNSGSFARLLGEYDIPYIEYLAPVVIIGELLLGLALILQIWSRVMAVLAAIVLLIFTGGFTYGLLVKDITDCGCFGQSSDIFSTPLFLYVRNTVMILMLAYVMVKGDNGKVRDIKYLVVKGLSVLIVACGISFVTGLTFRRIHSGKNYIKEIVPLAETGLGAYASFSQDSTYLVFAFSYKCPHCMNSIANLKEYVPAKAVDRVIAVAVGDSVDEALFRQEFKPNFSIVTDKSVLKLTNDFPKAYYIRHDSLITSFAGELPCAKVFKKAMGVNGK